MRNEKLEIILCSQALVKHVFLVVIIIELQRCVLKELNPFLGARSSPVTSLKETNQILTHIIRNKGQPLCVCAPLHTLSSSQMNEWISLRAKNNLDASK